MGVNEVTNTADGGVERGGMVLNSWGAVVFVKERGEEGIGRVEGIFVEESGIWKEPGERIGGGGVGVGISGEFEGDGAEAAVVREVRKVGCNARGDRDGGDGEGEKDREMIRGKGGVGGGGEDVRRGRRVRVSRVEEGGGKKDVVYVGARRMGRGKGKGRMEVGEGRDKGKRGSGEEVEERG